MSKTSLFLSAAVLLVCPLLLAQDHGAAVDDAEKSSRSWLALVDAGQYGESWDQAAPFFQEKVTKGKWKIMLESTRAPLGAMQSRELKSATYTTDLPNAPKGEYVVLQYQTSFTNMEGAVETITPMKQADGTWKVSGYFIRPAD